MKYCINCGTQLSDESIFCEECGEKQEANIQENISSIDSQQNISSFNNTPQKRNGKFKYFIAIIAIVLLVSVMVSAIKSCSSPKNLEDVASDFAEALLIDFNAKKTVSLMSEELLNHYMDKLNFSSERELIDRLKETFKDRKEGNIAYYGDDWKAKVVDVEIEEVEDDLAIVIVSVSHEGSDALWHTNIDELWVYLVKEDDEWRVYHFEE